jgi:serine/threonine-protein kinase
MFLTDPDYVERFRREAQRVAALDHPHIAPVLQFLEQGRELYVVMPLYAESLRERLDRDGRLPLAEAVRIVSEIGSALATAHAHGLIHRDVKAGNILLDEYGYTALADFGIARQATFKGNPDTLTLAGTGLPVGTPQYMPPRATARPRSRSPRRYLCAWGRPLRDADGQNTTHRRLALRGRRRRADPARHLALTPEPADSACS